MSSIFYPYRLFMTSGNFLQVYRPETDEQKLSIEIKRLVGENKDFGYFTFDKEGVIVSGFVYPECIMGADRPFGIKPVDLDERKNRIEEARKKVSSGKTNVGSNAIDITQRK